VKTGFLPDSCQQLELFWFIPEGIPVVNHDSGSALKMRVHLPSVMEMNNN
jgi:hypothetical protein